jgi:hypothetical protein
LEVIAALLFAAATTAASPLPAAQIALDAHVIDRVAELSKHDMPRDLLRRMMEDDIELMRGKRADGSYAYATHERLEADRKSESFSVQDPDKSMRMELRGSWVYRLTLNVPSRRLLVTKNKHVFVERVEIEYIPEGATSSKVQALDVNAYLEPGVSRNIDLDQIARQATARVYAHADPDGYGNIELALLEAKIFDSPDSPYADAVASAKAILRGIDHDDVPSIRAMAQRLAHDVEPAAAAPTPALAPAVATSSVDVVAPRADADMLVELQAIEDLLTGTEAERRQGLDRLHQLLRRMRQR